MLGFFLPLLFAATPLLGLMGGVWTFTTTLIAFVGFPLLDLLLPKADPKPVLGPKWFFNFILFSFALYHPLLILFMAYKIYSGSFASYEIMGLILSTGIVSGLGITFAHELVHRKEALDKFLGELILVFVCYGHFAPAHVYGHHRKVGTPSDPATAKRDQSIYSFYVQALTGVFAEALRLRRKLTLIYTGISLLLASLFFLLFGVLGILFFFAQSFVAALLLETIDYIEHYGLTRKEISPGRYEGVKMEHSWDSDAWLTGKILIHLQRHADHHLHVLKKYQDLELPREAAKLPTGYSGMVLLALIPPLWFRVMNPRLITSQSDLHQ